MAELTESNAGQIEWPATVAGDNASVACPFGPLGSYASQQCVRNGEEVMWGVVDEDSCLSASQALQELAVVGSNYIYNKYMGCRYYFSGVLFA